MSYMLDPVSEYDEIMYDMLNLVPEDDGNMYQMLDLVSEDNETIYDMLDLVAEALKCWKQGTCFCVCWRRKAKSSHVLFCFVHFGAALYLFFSLHCFTTIHKAPLRHSI